MRDWLSFWNAPNQIYVSERHRDVHYRDIAMQLRSLVPAPDAAVLDYGCGEATQADLVAAAAGRLLLSDGAPSVREKLAARFRGNAKIAVLSPEEVAGLPPGSLDLIVLNSVAQYLKRAELDALLARFHRLLKPTGTLALGDIIPPNTSAVTDVRALLTLAARNGFLGAALLGLVRTVFSDYRALRSQLGLSLYTEAEITEVLAKTGFTAKRRYPNIEHNPSRMTFLATPLPRGNAAAASEGGGAGPTTS